MLVGGQVPALLGRDMRGTAVVTVETDSGVRVDRPYSFEPDLLFDAEAAGFQSDRFTLVLHDCGYRRVTTWRYAKSVGGIVIELDVFAPPEFGETPHPTGQELPRGDVALLRPECLEVRTRAGLVEVAIPSATAFLAMKLEAKLRLRPAETKDSFDLFAYVQLVSPEAVTASLQEHGDEGTRVRKELRQLFDHVGSPGVQDVLAFAAHLEPLERELLAQAVVDTMAWVIHR